MDAGLIRVLTYRKSDGRSGFLCLESDGINKEIQIQDAVSRLVDFKSLDLQLKLEGLRDYESEEYLVRVIYG